MKKIGLLVCGLVLTCAFNTDLAVAAEKLTYTDLIGRLTDLEHLAVLPPEGEKCQQFSSYDRRSVYDASSGKYVGWSANGDGDGFIRTEGQTQVLAEMEGPGVIWRIWSALAEKGHVQMYLDGSEDPVVDLPFIGYFNRQNAPFTGEALVHMAARGQNCYVPIPFQKSCKIVADKNWGRYYHFTYTTYPKGTVLPTFSTKLSKAESQALAVANHTLMNCGSDPAGEREGQQTVSKSVEIPGDTSRTVLELEGTRAITAIKVRLDLPESPEDVNVLREITISMHWDGDSKPAVWAPLGDFFGTAAGENYYKSLPLGMTEDGYYCYWYMPFRDGAVIKLTNDGDESRSVHFSITHAPVTKPIQTLGRFHAKWHRDAFLPEDDARRAIDWTMLKTDGRGRYCGVMLHVWNPRGGWWGEGDEKIYIDGEKFPSTFGTGSEDYFGYAWCNPELFENCYHNQTISMGNRGHVSVNRWHISDNMPFQESFEAAIEKYYPNSKPTLYAATAYWYQGAGQDDPYDPAPVSERTGYWTPIKVMKVKGAIEGEKMKVLSKTGGNAAEQNLTNFGTDWSRESHLWWTQAKPGDKLELALPVEKTGSYRIKMNLTKARDYGIVQLYLDGKKLGGPVDLYNPQVVPTGAIDFKIRRLEKGNHNLTVEIVGANEKALKQYMFGLDYVLLEEVETSFHVPPNPDYTIIDSAKDSVRFAVEKTLVPYKGNLACKSSFVDQHGNIMGWHDFGNLEGPGWAANAAGGAYEIYAFAKHMNDQETAAKALKLIDHVLEDGFIDWETGFITGYRETTTDKFCLTYQHKNNWFCAGSMARIAYQLLVFADILEDGPRKSRMQQAAIKNAKWIAENLEMAPNGWYPRRSFPDGRAYPKNSYGHNDILFEASADGLFIIQLNTALTERGMADYRRDVREKVDLFMDAGGIFGSINHDTYDHHECVSYAVAFRVLRQAAAVLDDKAVSDFAYKKCLGGLDRFKMTENRNGVQTRGLLWMEESWDTAYLWENAEASLAYLEAYDDTKNDAYLKDGLTILRAIARHHHGPYGFLTEGVDWNNHVGKQHHFGEAEYGDIKYTEPLLNNLHIVEPTLYAIKLGVAN